MSHDFQQRLVMVMGVQRSGTNALFNSFAADTRYRTFNESDDSEIFFDWNLRPESQIRPILSQAGPVLLKPVNETDFREVVDVLEEYCEYDVWIPWIYRDPVNVHFSWWIKWQMPPLDAFIDMWNRRNQSILNVFDSWESRIAILRYEDLIQDSNVFEKACEFFRIQGQSLFEQDSISGRKNLPQNAIEEIDRRTERTLQELNTRRRFVSAKLL